MYVTLPTLTARSLNVTVRLRDTTSSLLTTGTFTQVQVCTCLLRCGCTLSNIAGLLSELVGVTARVLSCQVAMVAFKQM